jgi:hypothetical protein
MMGYNPYPYPGEYDRSSRKGPNKGIFIIGGIVVLLIIIIAVAASMSGGGNGNNNGAQQPNTDTSTKTVKDVVDRDDSTLDLSVKTTNDALKAQTIKGNTRQQLNLSSGFSFMTTKVDDYLTNNSIVAGSGKRFVIATIVIGNRLQSDNISVSYLDFRLRDQNNVAIAPQGAATNSVLNNPLSNPTELKPGEQLTGRVVFEVGATDTNWVLVHSETYQKTTDDTTFNVEGDIVLQLPLASSPTPSATPPTPAPSST